MVQRYKTPFVLAASAHGPMILSAIDWRNTGTAVEIGVGLDILMNGEFDLPLISMTVGALQLRRQEKGAGVVALDCGANIGAYSLEWGRAMDGWGRVLAFEPQERIYYALCGNLALNNLFNVQAITAAIGEKRDVIDMPAPDYCLPGQFGGLNLRGQTNIGQEITNTSQVQVLPIDGLGLKRVDFIKLDIEGMEVEALRGARGTIERNQPLMLIEWHICGFEPIEAFMADVGYETVKLGMNVACAPKGSEFTARLRELAAGQAVPA